MSHRTPIGLALACSVFLLGCAGQQSLPTEQSHAVPVVGPPAHVPRPPAPTQRGHSGYIARVAMTTDMSTILSAGEDGYVRMWDAATGRLLREIRVIEGPAGGFEDVGFSADGDIIFVVAQESPTAGHVPRPPTIPSAARSWDESGAEVAVTAGVRTSAPGVDVLPWLWDEDAVQIPNAQCASYSRDLSRVVVGLSTGGVQVYDASSRELLVDIPGEAPPALRGVFNTDGSRVLIQRRLPRRSRGEHPLDVLDVESGRVLLRRTRTASTAALSPDGEVLFTRAGRGPWEALAVGTGEVLAGAQPPDEGLEALELEEYRPPEPPTAWPAPTEERYSVAWHDYGDGDYASVGASGRVYRHHVDAASRAAAEENAQAADIFSTMPYLR